jgi:hypothetical protein
VNAAYPAFGIHGVFWQSWQWVKTFRLSGNPTSLWQNGVSMHRKHITRKQEAKRWFELAGQLAEQNPGEEDEDCE